MSSPKDHHYLPRFYLKAWTTGGRLVEFSRPYRDVVTKFRPPKGAGFETGLYSLPSEADPRSREQVELNIMQKIDDGAAPIHARLLANGPRGLSPGDRSAWVWFVNSLLFRTPVSLAWLDDQIRNGSYNFSAAERAEYAAHRKPDYPADPNELFGSVSDGEAAVARMTLMVKMIGSRLIGGGLFGMAWEVLTLSSPEHGFLTSDDPVMGSNGMAQGDSFVMLTLGPRHLFVAGSSARVIRAFASQEQLALERAINAAVVDQAWKIVVGQNDSHKPLVSARLGRTPRTNGVLGRQTWKCP